MSKTLAQFLPEHLSRKIRTGRQLMAARRRAPDEGCLATGRPALDRLLGGGVRRGQMTELVGRRTAGRFSAVLSALAATTGAGEAAALVDLGDALCPETAVSAGVELERLLWVRPQRMKEALMAAEAIIACGMPLVVLDLGLPPIPGGRGAEAFWLRLARSAQSRRSAVLVSAPYRVTGTTAQTVVEIEDARAAWDGTGLQPRILGGLSSRLRLTRGRDWQRTPTETEDLRPSSSVADASPADPKAKAGADSRSPASTPKSAPGDPLMAPAPRRRAIA